MHRLIRLLYLAKQRGKDHVQRPSAAAAAATATATTGSKCLSHRRAKVIYYVHFMCKMSTFLTFSRDAGYEFSGARNTAGTLYRRFGGNQVCLKKFQKGALNYTVATLFRTRALVEHRLFLGQVQLHLCGGPPGHVQVSGGV